MDSSLENIKREDTERLAVSVNRICQSDMEVYHAILAGEREAIIRRANQFLIDSRGRCIPHALGKLKSSVCDSDPNFSFTCPEFDFEAMSKTIKAYFPQGLKFPDPAEVVDKSQQALDWLGEDEQEPIVNLIKGPYFILGLPQMEINDYGEFLDEVMLPIVKRAYLAQFPNRFFKNYCQGNLIGRVGVCRKSRNILLQKMATAPQIVILFPCLQGFSVEASREYIGLFPYPDKFFLAGAIETAMVYILYPEVIAGDLCAPGLDCAANTYLLAFSLCFNIGDVSLGFSDHEHLSDAFNCCSNSICLFL